MIYIIDAELTFDPKSAILTMFQIPDAANDPVTRTAALLSLISALWSLSFGCIYILRFGTMRSMSKASQWAEVPLLRCNLRPRTDLACSGSAENENVYLVECLGASCNANNLVSMVRCTSSDFEYENTPHPRSPVCFYQVHDLLLCIHIIFCLENWLC